MNSIKMSSNRQTLLNLTSGILTVVIQLLISFFLSPYIVRTLGEEANGFTQLANNFVMYASLLTLAFNSMSSRFISVSFHQGDIKRVGQYYSSTYVCNIIISIVLGVLGAVVLINLERIIVIQDANVTDVKLLFLFVFVNYILGLFVSIYNCSLFVKNQIYMQNIINMIKMIFNALLLFAFFSIFRPRIFYVALVAGVLTALCLPIYIRLQKNVMPELRLRFSDFDIGAVVNMLKSGMWNMINQCGNMFMTGMDLLMANLFISPMHMGVLSVAKTIPNAIITLANTLNSSFAPALTREWAKNDSNELLKQLRSSMKISSVIISIPIITFTCFSVPFYELWMPTLDAEQLALLSFLSCMAFIPWAGPQSLYNIFTAANKLQVNSMAFVISGIINIVMVYVLLLTTDLGVYAVAGVSSVIVIIRNLVITAPYTARLLNLPWYTFYRDVLVSLICCGTNALSALIVGGIISCKSWIDLVFAVILTCLLTLALDTFFVLSKKERQMISSKIIRRMEWTK